MAHFAQISDGVVTNVIVISNDVCGPNYPESEPIGQAFISSLGLSGTWLQTSYNRNFRKNYGSVGCTYDAVRDAFIVPKPFNSWVLNEETCRWESPVPYPADDKIYVWNEDTVSWIEVTE